MNLPPDSFYYILSILLGGALIWVIKISIHKTDDILKKLSEAVADLKTIVAVHEEKHEQHEKAIEEIKNKQSKKK